MNSFLTVIQRGGKETMFASNSKIIYEEFEYSEEDLNISSEMTSAFLNNMKEMIDAFPCVINEIPETSQVSEKWRTYFITSTNAKIVCSIAPDSAKKNFLLKNLWQYTKKMLTPAMRYGKINEDKARQKYKKFSNDDQEIIQRDAFRFLTWREVTGNNFYRIRTYYNRTGILELKERVDFAEIRKRIRHVSGCPSIEVTNYSQNYYSQNKKSIPEKSKPEQSGPSLSYVVRDVDKLYTDEDLKEHLEENYVHFSKCWRIFSRARNEATKMIRVITHDPDSYSDNIAKGLFIYGRMHKCEPSFTSIAKPTIKYCNKCCKSGHSFDECQERNIVCPFLRRRPQKRRLQAN
ncbi:hypothetical protein JTB14_025398 [Gonioctena quinquepunctata]|nr:hypothetical protein JTB14_025398 [Gonioctena quinquepunctata]